MNRWIRVSISITAIFVLPFASISAALSAETILSFNGTNGDVPQGGLIEGPSGELYGATIGGGPHKSSNGVVFELVPPKPGRTSWTQKILHEMVETLNPSGLTLDPGGALYVSTVWGGKYKNGDIIKLTPSVGDAPWVVQIVHEFKGGVDGGYPGPVTVGTNGWLYGVATTGHTAECAADLRQGDYCGEVFALSPPATSEITWTMHILHHFRGADGAGPQGRIVIGASGELYGTATAGGQNYIGRIFRLTPPIGGLKSWSLDTLYKFNPHTDGTNPDPIGLVVGPDNYLYGTTVYGGPYHEGSVYRLLPPPAGTTHWIREDLHDSNLEHQGFEGEPAFDEVGNVYVTAYNNGGSIIRLSPPGSRTNGWKETQLSAGNYPFGPVVVSSSGTIYAERYLPGDGSIIAIKP